MFRPRIGQQILFASLLGLVLSPVASWASTVVPKPFNSYTATPASLSIVNAVEISNSVIFVPNSPATPPDINTYNAAVNAAAPNVNYFSTANLQNNDLIIVPAVQDAAHALATYQAVNDAVRAASDGGAWDGNGITSGFAAADANGNQAIALGVLLNDDGSGSPLWGGNNSDLGAFDGDANLTQFDTIVKYTFVGDLFLEGLVSNPDAIQIFKNLNTTPAGNSVNSQTWNNGDEFYQATGGTPISNSNEIVAFKNLSLQNQYPYTYPFDGLGGAAVPEPSTVLLALLGCFGLFFCRKSLRPAAKA